MKNSRRDSLAHNSLNYVLKNTRERCRAYLANYRNENTNELQFVGRGNLGVISFHLPLIYQKAKIEKLDFYETLDYYLDMVRKIHIRRFEYVGKAKASSNPLMWMQGGAFNGNLKAEDTIESIIKSFTISFGVTALNELQLLHNGKSLKEDNSFAKEVMEYIDTYVEDIKEKDRILYAIYYSPSETLSGLQAKQFKDKFGAIDGIFDKDYVTNGFHLHVTEEVTPFDKQDLEEELFHFGKGGHIQYGRFGNPKNIKGLKTFILRGLEKGFYVGVNFGQCTCEDCGHEFVGEGLEQEVCPNCNSTTITEVSRINGYMGYRTIKGDTTLNASKLKEINDRKSM